MIGVRILVGAGNFYLLHPAQTGSGIHPASYPVGTGDSFPVGKVAGHSSPSSAKVKVCGAIPPLPSMSSWSGA
jgi:hypothetical protein